MIEVQASGASCGATVRGIDLSGGLDESTLLRLRQIWLEHQVIAVVDQDLSIEDLEQFTLQIGPRGEDPFIAPIPGHQHVVEIRREAGEQSKLFAENWHSDWSFLPTPPAGTALYARVIPPVGGDTRFADQSAPWSPLPAHPTPPFHDRTAIPSAPPRSSSTGPE